MNELTNIKNIIFDLGNVLLPLNFAKLRSSFEKLAANRHPLPFKTLISQKDFLAYETGGISTSRFIIFLKSYLGNECSDQDIITAWNSLLGQFPPKHVSLLKVLGKKYRLFMLSNTNALHVEHFEHSVPGITNIRSLFENVYYSNEEGLRKPQEELFQRVLSQNKLHPHQTLYADDLEENCDAASTLGIRTLHVTPETNLNHWFLSRTNP